MKLSQFEYHLPQSLIAQEPTKKESSSRMMVVNRQTGKIENKNIINIMDYFDDKDVFVINNSKVFPSKLYGRKEKTDAKIEVFLLRELNAQSQLWDVLVDPARKIRVGNKLYFGGDDELMAEVIDNTTSRGRTIKFLWNKSNEELKTLLATMGDMPIPKYIRRKPNDLDRARYQTVYASVDASVVAPGAGLHFTNQLIKRCEIKGIKFVELTMHISINTLKPIDVEDLSKYKMDSEFFKITDKTCDIINTAKDNRRRICSIGASTLKALESSCTAQHFLKPTTGWSNFFIHPPYHFNIADSLLTNFQFPKTSWFITTCAFAGYDLTMEIYKRAIKDKYHFLVYGDALLII